MKKSCRLKFLALSATLMAPLLVCAASPAPQVVTGSGPVSGNDLGAVHAFLGIPYATPPIGNLRWKPPVPATEWREVRKATEFGSHCMQVPFGDMAFRDAGQSEDCLTLNVWTPAGPSTQKRPVMLWIHGGGFFAGASSEGRQDGSGLAAQDVVVVSMNYRLGILGFLVLPELAAESGRNAAGNYGLLDQTAALRWVHDNIAAFGGDPRNVTIFGESAGSFSVSALMASPLTKGLFHKVIGESGAAFDNSTLPFATLSVREEKDSLLLSSALGKHTLAELRAMPALDLLNAIYKANDLSAGLAFTPGIDGYFLPDSLPAIFAAGKHNDVPLLAGWNRDEGSLNMLASQQKPTVTSLRATAQKEFGNQAGEFLRFYPAQDDAQASRSTQDFAGDSFIGLSTWWWMEAQLASGRKPVYRYRFDLAPPPAPGAPPILGAFHSAEIEYVFGKMDAKANIPWRASDRHLSEQMQKYWINFARSGDPNGPGLPAWPAYASGSGWTVMYLDEQSAARKDDLRERYLFLSRHGKKAGT